MRDFRNGFFAVEGIYTELAVYVEHSQYLADWCTNLVTDELLANVFAKSGTVMGDYLNHLTAPVKTIKRQGNNRRPAA